MAVIIIVQSRNLNERDHDDLEVLPDLDYKEAH